MLSVLVAQGPGRFAYTPLLPLMQEAESLTIAAAGYVASANLWGYLAGAIVATRVAGGRYGLATFRCGLLTLAATTAGMAAGNEPFAWGAIRFLAGAGGGAVFALGAAFTLQQAEAAGEPRWSGYYFSGAGLGIASTGALAWALGDLLDWREHWALLGGLTAALVVPPWLWTKPCKRSDEKLVEQFRPNGWGLPVRLMIVAYTLGGFGYVASATFFVNIASDVPALARLGPLVWVSVGLAAAPSCFVWLRAAEKAGRLPILMLLYALQAGAVAVPLVGAGALSVAIGGLLYGATFLAAMSLAVSCTAEMAGSDRAKLMGVMTAWFGAGQAISPAVAGLLAERTGSFGLAIGLSAVALAAAAVLVLLASRRLAGEARPITLST
jgi:predicted MFS family arabinose efflux permease